MPRRRGRGRASMLTNARRIRSIGLAILGGLFIVLTGVGQGQAREYEIDGTADCGLRSGRRCSIGSVLAVWTDHVSGTRERIEINVSWVRDDLGKIDQDDLVCLVVEDGRGGRLR